MYILINWTQNLKIPPLKDAKRSKFGRLSLWRCFGLYESKNKSRHTYTWLKRLPVCSLHWFIRTRLHTSLFPPPLFLSLTSSSLTCSFVRLKLHHHILHLLCLASIEVWEHFQFLKAHSHASISRNQCTITLLCLDFFCSVWAMSILCRDSGVHY